ncbi:tyrosine-type recombinase/integrase [Bradyrhizobium sp. SYSU BS000235]|uniref:tyrosine-type recombinase/integrase n=1 Tax=Bradyrhizobium sp. SYSU BS000235 TaxID=3411332 RepID=UPI003C7098B2
MGRYGAKKEFQVGDWWLGEKPGSDFWHRCRYDGRTRQTTRISLGVRIVGPEELEQAKLALTNWWIGDNQPKEERSPADILLAEVLLAYYHQHASKLPSGRRIKASLKHLTTFFDGMSVKAACSPAHVENFVAAMKAKGFLPTYINNLLGILKAATQRAYRRGELASAPFVELIEAQRKKPKGDPLKPAEIAALLSKANKNTHMMIMLMMGTGCRPSTACELVWECIDFEHGLIDLNPPGRVQTAKYRPIVRMPPSLRAYLWTKRGKGLLIKRANKPIRRWEGAWRNCRTNAKIDKSINCQPYSIRHTVARHLRASGVVKWNIEAQLGHSALSTTDIYAPHAPDYLADACAAIDKFMSEVTACGLRVAV